MKPTAQQPRFYKFRKYQVPQYIKDALDALKPPDDITVSQWAEQYRQLSRKESNLQGAWRNSVTPYLVGIMDEFNNWETERIVVVKPTQVGGTEVELNALGYLIDQDPAPTLIVYPNDEIAESTSANRIMSMLESPRLKRHFLKNASSKKELQFTTDMYIALTGAGSAADLSSKPIRYLFLDEVDKFKAATTQEADPISLSIERTKSYFSNRKIYICSTPTLKTGHIWKAKEACDIEKHFFVPCPHCGKYIELKFAQIRWPGKDEGLSEGDRAEAAQYICQECNGVITDHDKPAMLLKGEWRNVRQSARTARSVAFWFNTLYSPFTRFSEIAREFMKSKDDPDKLHNFANSWLAEPWEDTKLKTSADLVQERQTELEMFELPPWTKLLTGGVDVQETSLYWTIRAWGDYSTSQNIAHGQAASFGEVVDIMNLEFKRDDGQQMLVDLALVDSGDQTEEVYDFCMQNSEWALPVKGTDTMLSNYKISTINKAGSAAYGMRLVLVDGGKYKDAIASRMRRPNGKGSWMVYKGVDQEYCEQVTAEHKITERSTNGTERTRWVPKTSHPNNHFLDCEVYAYAAAEMLGVRSLHLQNKGSTAQPEAQPAPQQRTDTTPEESWIHQNDGWF